MQHPRHYTQRSAPPARRLANARRLAQPTAPALQDPEGCRQGRETAASAQELCYQQYGEAYTTALYDPRTPRFTCDATFFQCFALMNGAAPPCLPACQPA